MALYAWSDIRHATSEEGKPSKEVFIARGSKVSKGDLPGLTDADWNAMLSSGAVRDRPFPAPDDYPGSALDYLRDQLAEAQAVSPLDEEEAVVELAAVEKAAEEPAPPPAEEPAKGSKK